MRTGSVTVGPSTTGRIGAASRETIQVRKARAIGVDLEHRAIARIAPLSGSIQGVI